MVPRALGYVPYRLTRGLSQLVLPTFRQANTIHHKLIPSTAFTSQLSRSLTLSSCSLHNSRFTISSGTNLPSDPLSFNNSNAGLGKLDEHDEIYLVQKSSRKQEGFHNVKMEYKYEVTDRNGACLLYGFHMFEASPPRFEFKLLEPDGSVLVTHKLFQGLSSKLLNMQIMCPGGLYLGSIEEKMDNVDAHPIFELRNSRDEVEAVVLTDFAHNGKFRRSIKILTPDHKTTIGRVSKKWGGFKYDNLVLRIQLPKPMQTSIRTSLIGLSILLSQRYSR